jgi:general secretion pathway protein K
LQKRIKGTAIVVALFVVALVTAAAVAMMTRLQQDMHRTDLEIHADQAYFYAQGSLAWAFDQLINDWKNQQPNQIIDKTPIQSPTNTVNQYSIKSTILDAQGFFNLNNLSTVSDNNDPKIDPKQDFSQLIKAVVPDISVDAAKNISVAVADWISVTSPKKFDADYAKLSPPYRAPHRLMASVSELRLVKGMTAALYEKLSPYIIALPVATSININNAAVPVIRSLSPTLSAEAANAIFAQRQKTPFTSIDGFKNFDVVKNNPVDDKKITVLSSYFLIKTIVTIGEQTTILYTLVERTINNSQPAINIIWQTKGTL